MRKIQEQPHAWLDYNAELIGWDYFDLQHMREIFDAQKFEFVGDFLIQKDDSPNPTFFSWALTIKPSEQEFKMLNEQLESNYKKVALNFEERAKQWCNPEILADDENNTITFKISWFK